MIVQPTIESISTIPQWSHETDIYFYDKPDCENFEDKMYKKCDEYEPDLVFYIGAGNGPSVADPIKLKCINNKWPLVHICVDGGCPGWWKTLQVYKEHQCFSLTVSLDGSFEFPEGTLDLVTLTIGNPSYYKPTPWNKKFIELGFSGGLGSRERQAITQQLVHLNLLTMRLDRDETWHTYQKYADFMCDCKCVLNMSRTGMDLKYMHVKNRVIETALARACLFEQKGSPIHHWFNKDEDYLEWESTYDITCLLKDDRIDKEKIACNLHQKVRELHSPKIWFQKVLSHL